MTIVARARRMVAAAPRSPVTHVLGSFLQLGAQTLQIMLVGHLLGAAMVGTYGYCLAVITPLVLLANWHVRHARVMDGTGRFAWSAYARLRALSLLLAVPVLAAGLLLPGMAGAGALYASLAAQRLTEMWFDLPYSIDQRSGDIGRLGLGVGVRGLLGLLAFVAVLLPGGDLAMAFLAQTVASCAWWVGVEWPRLRRARLGEREAVAAEASPWRLWCALWPLGLTVAVGSLVAVFPRIALVERHGHAEAGHFILLGYLFIPAMLVQAALQLAEAPRLAQAAAVGDRAGLLRAVARLTGIQFLMQLALALGIAGMQVLVGFAWLAPGFAVSAPELAWFTASQCAAIVLNAIGLVFDAQGRYHAKLVFWLALTGPGLALTWWLAPQGISGVSIAAVVIGMCGGMVMAPWWSSRPPTSHRQDLPRA